MPVTCDACGSKINEGSCFCPSCGCALNVDGVETLTAKQPQFADQKAYIPKGPPRHRSSTDPVDGAHFVPGTTLAGRYRIVALLGKGGMGEVYRADDLKLGQTVALKFLPHALSHDEGALARFHREVRLARQVSHPNVCRVFDVGEADARTFLSMEYVDGEDLSSLLRRIGHLPSDKAIEIARQLCAGLAAAHEHDVIHRDLKPANAMLDGRGRVRITDFGLAGFAGESGSRAGTPAYMAPEQLAGGEITQKTDIYSLGLVLYEIFTGKRAYEAASTADMMRVREKSAPTHPSQIIKDIDPLVERIILRCLEKDPAKRPVSALQVSSAFPGGDPLAAALAAGETPSPEMVAAAGDEGVLHPRTTVACIAGAVAVLGLLIFLVPRATIVGLDPTTKSSDALLDRARDVVTTLGYAEPAVDNTYWLFPDFEYLRYWQLNHPWPQRARDIGTTGVGAIRFWYCQSPRALASTDVRLIANSLALHVDVPGMVLLSLDGRGHLLRFVSVPPQFENSHGPWPDPNWSALFASANLDTSRFTAAEPQWLPPVPFEARAEWNGTSAQDPSTPIHVVAAAYHGKLVYFDVLGPWNRPAVMSVVQNVSGGAILTVAIVVVFLMCIFFSRRNIRSGRADRKGASRIAVVVVTLLMVQWIVGAHHVPNLQDENSLFWLNFGLSLALAAYVWVAYLALEPYVRRQWPEWLISWTRIISGRVWDPLVGRDVLVGVLAGTVAAAAGYVETAVPYWFNVPPVTRLWPVVMFVDYFKDRGVGSFVSLTLLNAALAIVVGLFAVASLFLLQLILRKKWLAFVFYSSFIIVVNLAGENLPLEFAYGTAAATIVAFIVLRFGLLALVVSQFMAIVLLEPLTFDFSRWYIGRSLFAVAVFLGLALYGFRAALAGRPVLGSLAFED